MSEIFQSFEVNRDARWPIISKLIVLSLVFHTSAVATVLYVPSVRDSVNIAALLSRTSYVDKDYKRTQIGDEVQVLELPNKFRYPDGYFASEVPQEVPSVNPFPASLVAQAQPPLVIETPSPSPSPSPEASPTASPASSPATEAAVAANSEDEKKVDEKVEKQLNEIADENSVVRPSENEVNTRPLKDWLARANELKVKGQLDLNSQIEIKIEANLTKDCKLENANVIQKAGDARLLEVAKDMVAAIGDSGMLSFLRDPKKVMDPTELRCDEFPLQLTIKLDQNEIAAIVESQADSPARAAEMAKGYSGLLAVGQWLKRGRDEEMLYKSTKVTAEDKRILVNFSMPRQAAGEMLKKQLPAS
ncbi:MAG TPA: hypothetical protein VIB00_14255 [Pyrinomonadaceae bacterium]|jgi:hypothetical protein